MTSNSEDIDPRFDIDFKQQADPGDDQRWSTWGSIQPLCRGPQPRPDWVVTSLSALDTELGVLKTGKEADVFLIERAIPGQVGALMAAKRYRTPEHRTFQRADSYTQGRRVRRTRDTRALARKSSYGRQVAAGMWAWSEWEALQRLWALGVPVPYPVQIDGTEILLEWINDDGETAPRLAQTRPTPATLAGYFEQLRQALIVLAGAGLVHGDLSAYNILATKDRLVIIDLPQLVDLAGNPLSMDFLLRDCENVCGWFNRRGLDVDAQELFGELVAAAF